MVDYSIWGATSPPTGATYYASEGPVTLTTIGQFLTDGNLTAIRFPYNAQYNGQTMSAFVGFSTDYANVGGGNLIQPGVNIAANQVVSRTVTSADAGWVVFTFGTPIAVTAGQYFMVGFFAPWSTGYYALSGAFSGTEIVGPGGGVKGLADFDVPGAVDDNSGNGRFRYEEGLRWAIQQFGSAAYFADVVLTVGGSAITGSIASTLPALTQSAAGTRTIPTRTGTAASALSALTQSATGTTAVPQFTGTAASTLPGLSQSASGTFVIPEVTGTADSVLPALTQQAIGEGVPPQFVATGDSVLPALAQSATGETEAPAGVDGTAASVLGALGQTAEGTTALPLFEGPITSTLPGFAQAAEGTVTLPVRTGEIASVFPTLTQSAEGSALLPGIDGEIASTLPALTQQMIGWNGDVDLCWPRMSLIEDPTAIDLVGEPSTILLIDDPTSTTLIPEGRTLVLLEDGCRP